MVLIITARMSQLLLNMNDTLQCHRGEMYTAVSRKVGRLKSVKCTLQP